MLSYNECTEVRNLYRGYHFVDTEDGLSWNYGMSKSKESKELLILSKDVAERLGLKVCRRVRSSSRTCVQVGVSLVR